MSVDMSKMCKMPDARCPCCGCTAPLQMAQLKAVMAVVDPPLFKHLEKLGAQVSCQHTLPECSALAHAAPCLG